MEKILAVVLVTFLISATLGGLGALADNGAGPPESATDSIGEYQQLTGSDDLTRIHVTNHSSGLEISGPPNTNILRVDRLFLEGEIGGGWSASEAFSIVGERIVVEGRSANFTFLELGSEPVFTMGGRDQIEFLERPMWVSTEQEAHGGSITLSIQDGNTSGQQIYISRDWLWGHGITWFNVTHEDGTLLSVVEATDGVVVDVHHFSQIYINPKGLNVKQIILGNTISNSGDTRWHWQESVVEIDVDYNPSGAYEVLIGAEWLDLHIQPHSIKVYADSLTSEPISVHSRNDGCLCNLYQTVDEVVYYKMDFSTNAPVIIIEVIGDHLPVYTLLDDALAPHWGGQQWYEDEMRLEVNIGKKTSDYGLLVDKDWVEFNMPPWQNYTHELNMVEFDNVEYIYTSTPVHMTPIISVLDVSGSLCDDLNLQCGYEIPVVDPPVVATPAVFKIVNIDHFKILNGGGSLSCPDADGDPTYKLGQETRTIKSENPDFPGERQLTATACAGFGDDQAVVFWHIKLVARDGYHLHHSKDQKDPCWDSKRAMCLTVTNGMDQFGPDGELISWFDEIDVTDEDVETCSPWGGTIGATILGFGGTIGLSGQSCHMKVVTQDGGFHDGRWSVHKAKSGGHKFNQFHYGSSHVVPIAEDEIEATIHGEYKFRFHKWPYYYIASYSWSNSFTMAVVEDDNDLMMIIDAEKLEIGAEAYSYEDLVAILNSYSSDEGTMLATYVMGAKLHHPVSLLAPQDLQDALENADGLLSQYPGKLPWASGTIDPADAVLMDDARDVLSQFVNPVEVE